MVTVHVEQAGLEGGEDDADEDDVDEDTQSESSGAPGKKAPFSVVVLVPLSARF